MLKPRAGVVSFFIIFIFLILAIRLIMVSLAPDPRLQVSSSVSHSNKRGRILDRNGHALAKDTQSDSLYARPTKLSPEVLNFLKNYFSKELLLSSEEIEKLNKHGNFVWIKRKLTSSQVQAVRYLIRELKKNHYIKKDEIGLISETARLYPFLSATPVTGTVGTDNKGLQGLEYTFQSRLNKGLDITTTIDSKLTAIAYEELKKGIIKSKAEYGSVVIMKVDTREILSIVSFPTFDPNDTSSFTHYNFVNRATAVLFEPGSVMKQFSAGLALSHYGVTPTSPVYTCNGSIQIGDHVIHEHPHGRVNLGTIIQKSCNIGMIQVAEQFSPNVFYDFLTSVGFGQIPPIRTTGVEGGLLRKPKKWSSFSPLMIAIGQEIGVTTLQLAAAGSTIAGGGLYRAPVLVSDPPPNLSKPIQIMSPLHSQQLLQMMEAVVGENGTAPRAAVEGVSIAGKTGTGQVANPKEGGYLPDIYNAVFSGYVPADKPKLTIVVVVNRPHSPKHTGGEVAAPIFSSIVRRIIISSSYLTK